MRSFAARNDSTTSYPGSRRAPLPGTDFEKVPRNRQERSCRKSAPIVYRVVIRHVIEMCDTACYDRGRKWKATWLMRQNVFLSSHFLTRCASPISTEGASTPLLGGGTVYSRAVCVLQLSSVYPAWHAHRPVEPSQSPRFEQTAFSAFLSTEVESDEAAIAVPVSAL